MDVLRARDVVESGLGRDGVAGRIYNFAKDSREYVAGWRDVRLRLGVASKASASQRLPDRVTVGREKAEEVL